MQGRHEEWALPAENALEDFDLNHRGGTMG